MILLVAAMLSSLASVNTGVKNYSDEEIKHRIVMSCCYIDNSKAASRAFNYAKSLCADDKARFARLLGEIAQTNDVYIARQIISDLGFYGTKNELPMLYSSILKPDIGDKAMWSLIQLEGLTEEIMETTRKFLMTSEVDRGDRTELCGKFAEKVSELKDEKLRSLGWSIVYEYASSSNLYYRRMDTWIIHADPGYAKSKRRLKVLRAADSIGDGIHQREYAQEVLKELSQIEAVLPE